MEGTMVGMLQTTPRAADRFVPAAVVRPDAAVAGPGVPPTGAHDGDPLAAIAAPLTVAAGASIVMEGEAAGHLFRVASGVVKVYRTLPDGRCQITGFLFAGDFLGLAPEHAYIYGADAVGDVTLERFARAKVEQLIEASPRVARLLLRSACSELIAAQDQMLLLGRKTARERVASFLRLMARREGRDALTLPMTRAEMADYLGLTVETVSRVLSQLADDGAIRVRRAAIRILDPAALADAA
jgi:CRP/FNR family transcriptional regulator